MGPKFWGIKTSLGSCTMSPYSAYGPLWGRTQEDHVSGPWTRKTGTNTWVRTIYSQAFPYYALPRFGSVREKASYPGEVRNSVRTPRETVPKKNNNPYIWRSSHTPQLSLNVLVHKTEHHPNPTSDANHNVLNKTNT